MTEDPRSTQDLETPPGLASENAGAADGRIAELDRITIGREVEGDEGERVPSGSSGTVVAVWADGAAFEVEFAQPVSALATVRADAVSGHHPRVPR